MDNYAQRLSSEVQLFRIRVAVAESELKALHEQARQAVRRRKEIKRIAKQAKKQFKRSKAELSELKQALAKAEARLFKAGGRALVRKVAKPGSVTKPHEARRSKVPLSLARRVSAVITRPVPQTVHQASQSRPVISNRSHSLQGVEGLM